MMSEDCKQVNPENSMTILLLIACDCSFLASGRMCLQIAPAKAYESIGGSCFLLGCSGPVSAVARPVPSLVVSLTILFSLLVSSSGRFWMKIATA